MAASQHVSSPLLSRRDRASTCLRTASRASFRFTGSSFHSSCSLRDSIPSRRFFSSNTCFSKHYNTQNWVSLVFVIVRVQYGVGGFADICLKHKHNSNDIIIYIIRHHLRSYSTKMHMTESRPVEVGDKTLSLR